MLYESSKIKRMRFVTWAQTVIGERIKNEKLKIKKRILI